MTSPNTESDKSIDTILTSLKKYNLGQDPITEEPFTVEETMSFYPELKSAKSQLLAEILKGKETFEIPEYEQGILEAIPTQYLKELFNIKEK